MTTDTLYIERVESPIGRIEITSDGEQITSLSIERDGRLPHDHEEAASTAVLSEAVRQLGEYFAGERTKFDLPVRLAGTEFQRAVWAELQQLDFGQFTSYGEIGAAIGRPGSGRAIGGAVGANPVPIIVGCHRVLSSTGRITGFSAGEGIPTKVWLLDHESIGHTEVAGAPAPLPGTEPTPLVDAAESTPVAS
ncbi:MULTISPECIES: methylated-DNA--[protein]-cysteine S-methyltransferase [unclassified Leifsonia]|uniref:methylated-DNA--[protein]-cysteine S-methyltransferase n=1 Tax=unclassified Leifsonia TaxID=2663824 RepID=UPI0009E8B64D|nr:MULTISPECIES: methylated-DNA--[protein]-cysteine S-methyltransferase [unclassified Leifsonia]